MRVYELDPRHKHLLDNHSAGYWWVRPRRNADKYKGTVTFSADFGEDLRRGLARKVAQRRLCGRVIRFKRHGYVYGNVDFIHLITTTEQGAEEFAAALQAKTDLVAKLKRDAQALATAKILKTKYGVGYSGPKRIIHNRGSRGERVMWVWSFENMELGKRFEHVFHFIDAGQQVGKSRREFADFFGLRYECLQHLAAGKIKAHRGWTLIGEPTKVSHRTAIAMKVSLLRRTTS